MPFIVKNSQLSNDSLQALNELIEKDISAKCAFKILRIIKHISSIVEDRVAMEKKIFEKWVQRDEKGNPVLAKDDNGEFISDAVMITNVDEFSKEMSDLLNIENEIPFDKIDFEELGLDTIKIKDLIKIDFLFKDSEN
jgi:hypothetical protein